MVTSNHLNFLGHLVVARNRTQIILWRLLKIVDVHQSKIEGDPKINAVFQLSVGAAFSLWRAVVLAELPFEPTPALEDAKRLLDKVVSNNAILFPDEKETKQWIGGFYISHIQYRLLHLHNVFGDLLVLPELETFANTWNPFAYPSAATDAQVFFDDAANCLEKIIGRIAQLVDLSAA